MFAQLYDCPNHGQVWRVESHEDIDTERDEIETLIICKDCGREVRPVLENGKALFHALTEEEMDEEMFRQADDEYEDLDEDW